MHTATIVKPPSIGFLPAHVCEGCVGLKLNISYGLEGECDALCSDSCSFSMLTDELIALLGNQNPNDKSLEAAGWIDNNIDWSGGIRFNASCLDIPIPVSAENGHLLEIAQEEGLMWEDIFDSIVKALGPDAVNYNGVVKFESSGDNTIVIISSPGDKKTILFYRINIVRPDFCGRWFEVRRKIERDTIKIPE